MTYDIGNPIRGFRQAQQRGGGKPFNRIPNPNFPSDSWISNDNTNLNNIFVSTRKGLPNFTKKYITTSAWTLQY